ncbi:hypothetical protein KC361_g9267 [Hortaea werneckii]|nr:hypothetical protein KC361_g9267 [Hortaea werneckii]
MSPSTGGCSIGGSDCGHPPGFPYQLLCCLLTLDPQANIEDQLGRKGLPARMKNVLLICHPDKRKEETKGGKKALDLCIRVLTDLNGFFARKVSVKHQLAHLDMLEHIPLSPFWPWDVTAQEHQGRLPLDDDFQALDPKMMVPNGDPTALSTAWNRVALQQQMMYGRLNVAFLWCYDRRELLSKSLKEREEFEADINDVTEIYRRTERKLRDAEKGLKEANKRCDELNAQLANKDEQLKKLHRQDESLKNHLGATREQITKMRNLLATFGDGSTSIGSTSEATHVESLGSLHGSSSTNETDAGIHNAATPAKQDHRSTINTKDSPAARTRKRAQGSGNGGPSKRQKTGDAEDDRIVVE